MYLADHHLFVTPHALGHWLGRCGFRAPPAEAARHVAEAVAECRPATRQEVLVLDHWSTRRPTWSHKVTVRWDNAEVFHLVHDRLGVAFVVVADDPPAVLTAIPMPAARAEAVERKRAAKKARRRAAAVARDCRQGNL